MVRDLSSVETRFRNALRTGSTADLRILGYGEISTVVAVESGEHRLACKRLPPFDTRSRLASYRVLFEEYLERLAEAGVRVVASALHEIASDDGSFIAYCVQPILDSERLGPRILAHSDENRELFSELFDLILATVSPQVGFDAQLSNWTRDEDGWSYLDVTTPLLRDENGRDRLDSDLFLAALPWFLRAFVRRFLARGITDTYFDPRRVILDFLANLHKERLERHVGPFLERINPGLERPLSEREVARYYASDACLWTVLLALRRLDRWWQVRVRRRPYPFLLPGKIER